jgi:nicotinamide riboside kinase
MAEMVDFDINRLSKKNETIYVKSDFKFIKKHNGFRPGYMHVLLGMTSTGKTTLVRSILKDLYRAGKIFVWLSEETCESFAASMAKLGVIESFNNLIFESEIDLNISTIEKMKIEIENRLVASCAKIFILDNITTSKFYMGQFEDQSNSSKWLKEICNKLKIPFIILAHTRSGLDKGRLLEPDDIRGDKTLANLAEYFYIIQRMVVKEEIFTLLHVNKSRDHDGAGKIYKLIYNLQERCYSADMELEFNLFKEYYNNRNKL